MFFSNIKFNFFYLKLFISDRSLSGEKVAFLSCDQEPETLVAIFAQQLAEGGEFLPNKELEGAQERTRTAVPRNQRQPPPLVAGVVSRVLDGTRA